MKKKTLDINFKVSHYLNFFAGCFKDHVVGEDLIADYLLFTLNKQKCFKWVVNENYLNCLFLSIFNFN